MGDDQYLPFSNINDNDLILLLNANYIDNIPLDSLNKMCVNPFEVGNDSYTSDINPDNFLLSRKFIHHSSD